MARAGDPPTPRTARFRGTHSRNPDPEGRGGGTSSDTCPGYPPETAEPSAAEVFATYTRGRRVRAVAGRVEVVDGRWQLVALQLG